MSSEEETGTKVWPDDYSDEELIDEAAHEVVVGVLEGASFEFSVDHQSTWLDGLDVDHERSDLEERAKDDLDARGVDYDG